MKTVKRILAVCLLIVAVLVVGYLVYTLLIVAVLVVGYLVYTGSRLTDGQAIISQVGGVL